MSNVRFAYNNIAASTSATLTASTENSPTVVENLVTENRHEYWQTAGNSFPIDGNTNTIHINDGSVKAVTIAESDYTSGTTLASTIQTALNAASSGWTVSYSSNRFTMAHATATMLLSNRTDAIWDAIGFESTSDSTVSVTGSVRYHWYEFIKADLGAAHEITFISLVHPTDITWPVSTSGTITIEANSVDDFEDPALSVALEHGDYGAFVFIDDQVSTNYRYWRVKISDPTNPGGGKAIKLGHLFIGDHVTPVNRNMARGFRFSWVDPSIKTRSLNGNVTVNSRPKYRVYSGCNIPFLTGTDYTALRDFIEEVGQSTPFYFIPDYTKSVFSTLGEQTVFCRFLSEPSITHVKSNTYSIGFELEEVV